MNVCRHGIIAATSLSFGLLAAAPAHAASLTLVEPSVWDRNGLPEYIDMHIYVPDTLAEKPPILVACHSCGTSVQGYFSDSGVRDIVSAADTNGFIVIFPALMVDPPEDRNCWDVGSTESLTRYGGGDTHAIARMVEYTLSQYEADTSRVYVMGGSSGAMMTQALLALYPDVFKAGSARAGVPAGCWAEGYNPSNQWGNNCAGGQTDKTPEEWGDLVRSMYPEYTGPRPRVQLFHGDADETISYDNMVEAIDEWTNVLELSSAPTTTDEHQTSISAYSRQFWEDDCGFVVLEAWTGIDGGHGMGYESEAILAFLGLNQVGELDPYDAACPASGAGGAGPTGGASNAGGASALGGASTTGGQTTSADSDGDNGCSCRVGKSPTSRGLLGLTVALLAGLGVSTRRRRRASRQLGR